MAFSSRSFWPDCFWLAAMAGKKSGRSNWKAFNEARSRSRQANSGVAKRKECFEPRRRIFGKTSESQLGQRMPRPRRKFTPFMVHQETQTKFTVPPDDILVFHPRFPLPADSQTFPADSQTFPADSQTFPADSQIPESDQEDSEEETGASLHGDEEEEPAASQSPSVSCHFDPREKMNPQKMDKFLKEIKQEWEL